MSLLAIENLSLRIGALDVLRGVFLRIAPGETHGLIGESGSGKSMTALAAMRLEPRGARLTGRIALEGRDLLTTPERQLTRLRGAAMGMVFQEPMTALNPVQTIGAQVAEALRIHRPDAAHLRARTEATLARCELPPGRFPLSRYPHELSGGQRQRVVIAMAIACAPRLLIADEPTTALDVTTQAQILALLRRLAAEDGMGLLLITHDLGVVASMADTLSVMKAGEIVEAGPTARLLARQSHPYTKALWAASTHQPTRRVRPPAEPLLRVENVTRTYPGGFTAVNGVAFDLHKGESLGLVGGSGCGKTTLTRAILGLDAVQGGTITLGGRPMAQADRALRRRVQAVFQDPFASFNPRHRVARLVAEPLHLAEDRPDRHALVAQALESVGIDPAHRTRFIHEFSGGQRQRIAIARALILRPDLIVLDEAVSALDVRVRAQVLDLLADLSERHGLAYLFISHDLNVVRSVTDRVLVMEAGRIVEEGPTSHVLTAPKHPYTRSLIDAIPALPRTDAPDAA